jgi:predicted acyltransferase
MKRYLSLDILRGLTIFGMVFSAIIPHRILPAWMYHIQNPPPEHTLDFSVSGIGWVDLVFPIFIFCMGVAIPFAGASGKMTVKSIFIRFLMLWIFSYLYVFLDFSTASGWLPQLATVGGFAALFMLYISKPPFKWIRYAGALLSIALIITGAIFFDEKISIYRSGIIIFLLSFLYLFGALIWLYTKDNHKMRLVIYVIILLFAVVTMYFSLPVRLYAIKEIRWFFNIEYIYFLLILIPATYIGDLLKEKSISPKGYNPVKNSFASPLIKVVMSLFLMLFVVWMMAALFTEWSLYKFSFSLSASAIIWLLSRRVFPEHTNLSLIAMGMIVSGGLFLFYEGAITKVPCTISYCLFTTGISIYLLMISDFVTYRFPSSLYSRIFGGAGSNPLMSYIAFGALVMPLFRLTGFVHIYNAAYPQGWPWIGVARAAVVVLLTMTIVAYVSEKKIFWRA